jgi:hypothetical protein
MNSKYGLQLSLAAALLIGLCTAASAQIPVKGMPTPLSSAGGYARAELMGIYNDSIGTGYSVGSLNTIALNNARAQQYGNAVTSPNASAGRPRLNLQSGGNAAKPFSTFSPSPTTSPYLNLFREDFAGESDLNYNTLVKPQIQQQQFNQQVQRQGQDLARRMQSMAAQSDFNPQGDKNQFPTGHQTVFGYYGHFHPNKAYVPGKR